MSAASIQLTRPEPRRDRYGRYLLTDPTGKERSWQRVTTFARYAADSYNLDLWKQRQVARGLAARPDLLALAASTADPESQDGKKALNRVCEDAMAAAASSAGANTGTALHAWTEQVDAGQTPAIPAPWDADVAAYRRVMAANNVHVDPELIEVVVTCDRLEIAGTFDRVVTIGGERFVADVKTGKDPAAFPHDICVQLACYANADRMHRPGPHGWVAEPMIPVNRERALVIHLRPGAATCELIWFDIAAGWGAAQTSAAVRAWQKTRATALTTPTATLERDQTDNGAADPVQLEPPAERPNAERTAWLRERVARLDETARQRLAVAWPAHVPTGAQLMAAGAGTDRPESHIKAIAAVLDAIEADLEVPFGPSDPAAVISRVGHLDEGKEVSADTLAELTSRIGLSPARETVLGWARQANEHLAPFSLRENPTERRAHIVSGALFAAAASAGTDEVARTILEHLLGDLFRTAHTVGHALGSLSLAEAREFERLAKAFAEGTVSLTYGENGRPLVAVDAA